MNKSLYIISDELQQIIDNIEENCGEVDEFTLEALEIKQEELENKIENYCNAITMINSDVDCCKNEKQRINNIQNTKKNIVEKLKTRILEAVLKWGSDGKSGNKVLNLPTRKLFTKTTEKFVANDDRIATLSRFVQSYILELKKQGILMTGQDIDLKGMMAAINSIIRAEKGESYEPFTLNDLNYIQLEISTKCSLASLFDGSHDFAIDAMINPSASVLTEADTKNLTTSLTTARDLQIEPTVTLGHLDYNYSLTIK